MNLDYIIYALEIAKTKSINKAAENLFISQPNLSRTISKLEEELGYKVFVRTNQGIEPTIAGNDFLSHAQNLIEEYNKMKAINNPYSGEFKFSISVPKGSYITKAFTEFISRISDADAMSIDFMETSSLTAINNIVHKNFNLAIIRYQTQFEPIYNAFLLESGLIGRKLCEFEYMVALSVDDPLAKKDEIDVEDLKDYIELTHGDSYLPYNSQASILETSEEKKRQVRIYDSMGQLQMLSKIKKSYMFVFPFSSETRAKYGVIQKRIKSEKIKACDVLVYRRDYHQSNLDKEFVEELQKQINMLKK